MICLNVLDRRCSLLSTISLDMYSLEDTRLKQHDHRPDFITKGVWVWGPKFAPNVIATFSGEPIWSKLLKPVVLRVSESKPKTGEIGVRRERCPEGTQDLALFEGGGQTTFCSLLLSLFCQRECVALACFGFLGTPPFPLFISCFCSSYSFCSKHQNLLSLASSVFI